MKDSYRRPINIECINTAYFPDIALYIKRDGNYVLYKPHDREFTEDDRIRLQRNNVDFLYVRAGDMEVISDYLESSLSEMLGREDLSGRAKGRILYQTSVNYVVDIFETPEKAFNVTRCRNLIRHLMLYASFDKDALASLRSLIAHNYYIFVHSVQVTALTLLMHAELYQVSRDELLDVGIGSILHDFGMTYISNDILNKPDVLSDTEYHEVKQHTQKGYEFFESAGVFSDISLAIVRHHHEKYDGSGYPTALKGVVIPRSVQVTTLCDIFCALTTDRVYRQAISVDDALWTMQNDMKGAFNEDLLMRFIDVIKHRPASDMEQ